MCLVSQFVAGGASRLRIWKPYRRLGDQRHCHLAVAEVQVARPRSSQPRA